MAGLTVRDLKESAPAESPRVRIASHLENARKELHEAAGEAMREDELELYVQLSGFVGTVDGMRVRLVAEERGS
jgi:hypothetical protein